MSETLKKKNIILIIDSSILIIDRLISIIKEIKSIEKILTATNYREAVAVLREKKTDIVLLDIQLQGKEGIELLKYIVLHYPVVKVVILSNLSGEKYQRLCKKIGAVKFIDKSKDFDLIPEVVEAL